MHLAEYYRENAAKAHRLMAGITPGKTSEMLAKLALDYEMIAMDLEHRPSGTIQAPVKSPD